MNFASACWARFLALALSLTLSHAAWSLNTKTDPCSEALQGPSTLEELQSVQALKFSNSLPVPDSEAALIITRACVKYRCLDRNPQDIFRVYMKVQSATGMFDKYMDIIMDPLIALGLREADIERAIYLHGWVRFNLFNVETSMNVDHNLILTRALLLARVPDSKLHKVAEIFHLLRSIDDFYETGDLVLLVAAVVREKVDLRTATLAKNIYVGLRQRGVDGPTAARRTAVLLKDWED